MGETSLLVKPSLGEVALDDVFFTRKTKITSKRTKEHDGERSSRELDGLIETPFFSFVRAFEDSRIARFLGLQVVAKIIFLFLPAMFGEMIKS